MTRRLIVALALSGVVLVAASCASVTTPMQRALDPSMERVLITEGYLTSVAGISGNPARLTRSNGYVYLADVAPQMLYLAEIGDTVRYRSLRTYVADRMMRRDGAQLVPSRRYRQEAAFEEATPYGYYWLGKALILGWERLRDTTSAQLVAQMVRSNEPPSAATDRLYLLAIECADAMDVVASNPSAARAVLAKARSVVGSVEASKELAAAGLTQVDGELDALSCLTRAAVAANDPDNAVRHLDRMLDILRPLLQHSGRPDLGTSADVLRTLHMVRAAGPSYYARRRAP
jgi:hypothetical protein